MSQSKKAAKSVLIIVIFSIVSKLLGFVREMLMAARYGSDATTDAYFMALSAVALFSAMIINTIHQTTIPVLSLVEASEGQEGKRAHTNNLLNITLVFSIIITLVAWIFAPYLLKILAPGFEAGQFDLTVTMTRIGLAVIITSSIAGIFRGYLQSEMMFTESAIAQLPFNFVLISYLIFLAGRFDITGMMVAYVVASASMILVQIPGLRKTGYRYKPLFDLKDTYVRHIIRLMPPILLSVAIGDVNALIDKSMASTLAAGSISALNYSTRIIGLTTSIFIAAIATVIFPILSKEAGKSNLDGLKKITIRGFNVILLIAIPASVGMILLAHPIIKAVYERRAFDARATYMTAGALVFYSIGLVGASVGSLLNKVFYALRDTKTPMVNAFVTVIANVAFNFTFIAILGYLGLALATSLAWIIGALFLFIRLRKKIGPMGISRVAICGLKSLGASAVMGGIVYGMHKMLTSVLGLGTISEIIALFVAIVSGILVYIVLIYFSRIDEFQWMLDALKSRFKHSRE